MTNITISGRNDDLIEVTGDIRREFYANYDEPTYFRVLPDGVIIKVKYDLDGVWRLSHDAEQTEDTFADYQHIDHGDYGECDYSEAIRITGDKLVIEKTD